MPRRPGLPHGIVPAARRVCVLLSILGWIFRFFTGSAARLFYNLPVAWIAASLSHPLPRRHAARSDRPPFEERSPPVSKSVPSVRIGIFGSSGAQAHERHGCGLWAAGYGPCVTAEGGEPVFLGETL